MTQRYFHGQRVRIADTLPDNMAHFESGLDAVVHGSYSDLCGRADRLGEVQYCLLLLKHGKPYSQVSWYWESQLTLISDDREAGEQLLQQYRNLQQKYVSFV